MVQRNFIVLIQRITSDDYFLNILVRAYRIELFLSSLFSIDIFLRYLLFFY